MRALVVTGPPGAGKTAVLSAVMGLLEAEDRRHAGFEVEALALAHPWLDREAVFEHVALLAGSFRRRGYPLLLVGATIEDADYLRRLLAALGTDDVLLVRLEAPPALLRERVARREPPEWVGLQGLLDRIDALAAVSRQLPRVDLVLGTEGADPRAVAARVRAALDERPRQPR